MRSLACQLFIAFQLATLGLPESMAKELRSQHVARSFAPTWSESQNPSSRFYRWSNRSYLDETSTTIPELKQATFQQTMFTNDATNKWVQAYLDRTKAYEDLKTQEKMSLTDYIEYRRYHEDIEKITMESLMDIASYHFTEGVKKAEKGSDVVRTFNKVQSTVQIVSKSTAEVSVWEGVKFETRWNILSHSSMAGVKTPLVNANLFFDWGIGGSFGSSVRSANPGLLGRFTVGNERYVLSVDREIPGLQMGASLAYKGSSQALQGTLVRGFKTSERSSLICKYEDINSLNLSEWNFQKKDQIISFEFTYQFE